MAGSAALHAIILISGLIAWPWLTKPIHMGDVVPVTLITSDQAPAPAPAIQAPQPAPAATEQPVPLASPQAVAPEEAPTPTPPAPKVAPQPIPKPRPVQPAKVTPQPAPTPTPHKAAAQAKPTPAMPAPELDMAALSAELSKQARPSGARQSSAARGPSRPAQAIVARTSAGTSDAVSSAALSSLAGELQRLWNPNCEAAGASDITIKVSFQIGSSGRLATAPVSSLAGASDPVTKAASDRAVRAVYQGEPFSDLPPSLYGQKITVNFNPKTFCSNR
jgi:outer membrane biosynthesis protein TonB